jgi:hypothetical protein
MLLCPTPYMRHVKAPYDRTVREEGEILAQASIPYAWHVAILDESRKRGIPISDVLRDALAKHLEGGSQKPTPTLEKAKPKQKHPNISPYDGSCTTDGTILARAEIPYSWHRRIYEEAGRRGVPVSDLIRGALSVHWGDEEPAPTGATGMGSGLDAVMHLDAQSRRRRR